MTLRGQPIPLFVLVASVLAKHGEGDGAGDEDGSSSSSSVPAAASSAPASATGGTTPTATSSSVSPTSSAMAPSVNGTFIFVDPANMTTCQPATIKWSDTGSNVFALTLEVSNESAVDSALDGESNNTSVVSRVLTNSTLSTVGQFTWPDADVPAGWYSAVAFDTAGTVGLHVQSAPFFVQAGQNTSCVVSTPANSSSTSPNASSSASADTSQNTGSTGGLSNGALAGTIVAAVVGVVLLLIAFSAPHWWKRTLPFRARNRRPGGPYNLF
ncbi:hypothetical protein OBBRIDRAFT_836077 [Obba rivulosa]|uniref:Uncharacterized protein n=1 Tax=Obba rivulosa TaxID=1052685 RepID=A0A8E2AVI2_9APHY|nr:hypothetical protein OBBRIDRAFT_836077 [Obba rivulosa]